MAKQISTEAESNLKRQARRRLIGAVALVLAIVVILPMIFDSEPPPSTANDIELRIPDKDRATPFQPVAASAPVAEVASAVSAAPAPASAVISVPVSAVSATPIAVQPMKTVQPEIKSKVEAKPKPETKPKVVTKPKVETKPAANAVPKSGWVIQVGAYSNADTAKQLQAKLSKQSYHVYTEKSGNNVRVRVGSYPTREAAEKIKHKLEALGLHPNIVNLE
jgi:DedD protein